MKIFVPHATNSHFREALYEPLRASSLNKQHEIKLPQEHGKETITKAFIKSCDLILAEVSYPSTGQGIELGWADSYGVPILCISQRGTKVSSALQYVTKNFIVYDSASDMIAQIEQFLLSRDDK